MTTIVVMGVAGCGKSTFGQALAKQLSLPWIEGDDFHSETSKAKMSSGMPLDDSDRAGWLQILIQQIQKHPAGCVIGCSSLKQNYRNTLRQAGDIRFAYLRLTRGEAQRRVSNRASHFFSAALVESQFAALQEPTCESDVMTLDATEATAALVAQTLSAMKNY